MSRSDARETLTEVTVHVARPPSIEVPGLKPGAQIGRYHLLERIGAGGMGVVYAAFDPDLDRKIALKVLQPERLDGDVGSRGHARLIREAKAMAKLAHPNVVAVHDVGLFEERVFIAMEFVAGQTLTAWLKDRRPCDEVLRCFIAAGRGLAAAHAEGLVHRDFKPDNVLVGKDGRPRVLDFGLARSAGAFTEPQEPELELELAEVSLELRMRSRDDFADRITQTGGLTGTPAYMAPEQYLGKPLDARTDQFAFCVALWEGLHGSRPFQGDSTAALAMAVCSGERTPPPANNPVPARIQRALEKGLSQEPQDRFPSMAALLQAIEPERPTAARPLLWGAGGATLAVGVYAAVAGPAEDPCEAGESRLTTVWNRAQAEALRSSFAEVDAAFSSDSANAAVEQLDAYARGWVAAYRDACEATHVRREQSGRALDLRMSCLSRHLRALQSMTETLMDADEAMVRNAPSAVGQLPPLDACSDVEALDTWAGPPEDPTVAAAVQDIRERVAGLTAKAHIAPDRADSRAEVAALLEAAKDIAYVPLLAEVHFLAARYAVSDGDPTRGVEHLEETVYAALASDHDQVLAMALTQLTQSTGILLSQYEEGLRWSRHAEAALARLGDEGADAANFHAVMCKLLADKGDTDAALPHCERNVELYESLYGEESVQAGAAHESMGIAYFYAGRNDDALAEFELARDVFAATQGETHPDLARVANSLAAVCFQKGKAADCVDEFEDAVRRASVAFGDDHPMTSDFRNNLAQVQLDAGNIESARANARQTLAARRARGGDDHPAVAASLRILGLVDAADGDTEGARAKLTEALEIAKRTRGEGHRDVETIERMIAGLPESSGGLGSTAQPRARLE